MRIKVITEYVDQKLEDRVNEFIEGLSDTQYVDNIKVVASGNAYKTAVITYGEMDEDDALDILLKEEAKKESTPIDNTPASEGPTETA